MASRTVRFATVALGASLAGLIGLAPAASAATSGTHRTAARAASHATLTPFEHRILVLTNKARAAHGLRPVTAVPGATDVARRWTTHLVEQDGLSHNPALVGQVEHAGSFYWTRISENVGVEYGQGADALFHAYMASPHHRANILDPRVRFVGIGAIPVVNATTGWVETFNTMDFTDQYSVRYGANRTHRIMTALTSDANLARIVH